MSPLNVGVQELPNFMPAAPDSHWGGLGKSLVLVIGA